MDTNTHLHFTPFNSAVQATFWLELTTNKLDVYKLNDDSVEINGSYSVANTPSIPSFLSVTSDSFKSPAKPSSSFFVPGSLRNFNKLEDFKTVDKVDLINQAGRKLWECIKSGSILKDPRELSRFFIITFADLKKYKYYYWFAFPALLLNTPVIVRVSHHLKAAFIPEDIVQLRSAINAHKNQDPTNSGFFILTNTLEIKPLAELDSHLSDLTIAFVDPSSVDVPGWPLRNLLVFLKLKGVSRLKVLCVREDLLTEHHRPGRDLLSSLFLDLDLGNEAINTSEIPKIIGWEKNSSAKMGPRISDLGPSMDPKRLAETSVDLNLKLMRWRIIPDLDLDKIKQTKCLLLGAGTLGSYVARSLMGWGVRHITFVDNSNVSFSNPVRQPLYTFKDSLNGGSPKATAAAEALKAIFPSVIAEGHVLNIPMPDHPVTNVSDFHETFDKFEDLVKTHDVIFLLTDSRESRWLPTLLGATHGKVVLNAALGFDTFLVMRHGMRVSGKEGNKHLLGCYFCNDVVAPSDSLSDRTLDQQCTVTRPGLSAIAAALAVELLTSLLNHKLGPWAPADSALPPTASIPENASLLGLVPHQIRGFLSHFSNLLITGQAYDKCTACGDAIIDEFRKDGSAFVMRVCNNSKLLEVISGLAEMHLQTDAADFDWDEDTNTNTNTY